MNVGVPQQMGHRHLNASHYCMDGAIFEACFRLAQQQHGLWWETAGRIEYGELVDFYCLFEIVVGNTCTVHVAMTGLKKAVASLLENERMKQVFNASED